MTELPYPEGNDRATVVKDFIAFAKKMAEHPFGLRGVLIRDVARYLQEAEDVRAPALAAADRIEKRLGRVPGDVRADFAHAASVLRRVAGTEPTTPGQAVAGLTDALREADEAADRANKEITAALGDVKDALDELDEPGPTDPSTIDFLTNEGPGIIDRAIAAIDSRPAAKSFEERLCDAVASGRDKSFEDLAENYHRMEEASRVPKFAVPDIKVYAEREIARIAKEFGIDLTAFATEAAHPAPVWIVKEPGVRRMTGTLFEMRVAFNDVATPFIDVFCAGARFGDGYTRFSVAEEAVADYINENRETLVAFGFIEQETRT